MAILEVMNERRACVAGVGIVVMCGAVWLLTRQAVPESSVSEKANGLSAPAGIPSSGESKPERRERVSSAATRLCRPDFTSHEASQLKDFILPEIDGRDVSLDEALGMLNEAYQEACFQSKERNLALGFSVRDQPGHTITFALRDRSFLSCLNHLAALSGLTVERNGLDFELLRSETAGQAAEMSFQDHSSARDHVRALAGMDPSDPESDWETLLHSSGLVLEKGTKVTPADDGFYQITGTSAEIARVAAGLLFAGKSRSQFKAETKLVSTTSPLERSGAQLTNVEVRELLRSVSQQQGSKIVSQPSVVAREGQTATIEIIREDGPSDWTGTRSAIQSRRVGMKLVSNDRSDRRPEDPDDPGWLAETDSAVYPGNTHVELLASRDGVYHYRLLTVIPIDATGRPLGGGRDAPVLPTDDIIDTDPDNTKDAAASSGVPVAARVPGSPGFVFSPYSNKVIDVTHIPQGTLVADPTEQQENRKLFRVP